MALALLALAPCLGGGSMAWARRPRRIFEPTDLELEEPGSLELDLQLGVVHSREGVRVLVPDFEIDLGLHRRLELDVDGAIGFESSSGGYGIDHTSLDILWLSAKVGLIKRSIAPHLELSLAALIGEIDGSLHYGLLVGVAPKIRIWR